MPSKMCLFNWKVVPIASQSQTTNLGTFFVSHIYRFFLNFDRKVLETFERVQNNRNFLTLFFDLNL